MAKLLHTQTLHKKCERALRQKAAWEGSRVYAAENWPNLVCKRCQANFCKPLNPNWVDPCAAEEKPMGVMKMARLMEAGIMPGDPEWR